MSRPFPPREKVRCPKCGRMIGLYVPAVLQARQLGVSLECPKCGHGWIHKVPDPQPRNSEA